MGNTLVKIFNKIIEFSFYSLFFLVPLVFSSDTSELFELNKMWLTFAITIIVASSWIGKMIALKKIRIQRTPLDIPISLFLASQIISTIISLDRHVSIWGYYSRFNGGLLSIISYIILYYAFVSNFLNKNEEINKKQIQENKDGTKIVKRVLTISLASGAIAALWGFPSHFGYDPTCFIFRGNFDVSCWTEAFQPKVRIFSTLGQPDWLGAYLDVLLPVSIILFLTNFRSFLGDTKSNLLSVKTYIKSSNFILAILYLILSILFYLDLLFTKSKSNFGAFWISLIILIAGYIFLNGKFELSFKAITSKYKNLIGVFLIFVLITFFTGSSISQIDKFTFPGLKSLGAKNVEKETKEPVKAPLEQGVTSSGAIRLIVWEGALNAWKSSPIFGTGVETFAYSYYKFRPAAHNLTSEWDYLYNKAHNEYLNFLTTTGLFGLLSYLSIILLFLLKGAKNLLNKERDKETSLISLALISSFIAILISNFFGFSVVIISLYLFLIPAFLFVLNNDVISQGKIILQKSANNSLVSVSIIQKISIALVTLFSLYLLFTLFKFRQADMDYAMGSNLDKVGNYQQAYQYLHKAILERGDEPVFKDELGLNDAVLASAFALQKDATTSGKLAEEAIAASTIVTTEYPNNITFFKTRARIFYALSQTDPNYLKFALEALTRASELAPTDAKIAYNLGVIYGQTGDKKKAVEVLEETTKLKPNYRDAYYALGVFYHDLAVDKNGNVLNSEYQAKAKEKMQYILKNIANEDTQAQQNLKNW